MKNILVTGAAGFLGSHLCEKLQNLKYKVIGIDNLIGGNLDNLPKNIEFYKLDCCDFQKMNKIMKNIDVVYHCAATAHEGLSVFSPVENTKNNYLATVSVLTSAINNKAKRIIYCSSMARYGNQTTPFTEEMHPKPVDPYGISKVAGEEVLKNLCNLNNIEWVIAVPHNIIGPKQKYDDPYRNVVSIMINLMLQKRRPIIYGDGKQTRNFSDIDDCIFCLDKLIRDKKIKSEIFNIGPDEDSISINKLYEILSNKLQFNKDAQYVEDRPNEVKNAICSSDKARKFLSYKTGVNLSESIDKVIKYIKKNGPKKFEYNYRLEIKNKLTPKTWKNKLF